MCCLSPCAQPFSPVVMTAALSRRLHLGDRHLELAQLPCWQLPAEQLAQQQLTR